MCTECKMCKICPFAVFGHFKVQSLVLYHRKIKHRFLFIWKNYDLSELKPRFNPRSKHFQT